MSHSGRKYVFTVSVGNQGSGDRERRLSTQPRRTDFMLKGQERTETGLGSEIQLSSKFGYRRWDYRR